MLTEWERPFATPSSLSSSPQCSQSTSVESPPPDALKSHCQLSMDHQCFPEHLHQWAKPPCPEVPLLSSPRDPSICDTACNWSRLGVVHYCFLSASPTGSELYFARISQNHFPESRDKARTLVSSPKSSSSLTPRQEGPLHKSNSIIQCPSALPLKLLSMTGGNLCSSPLSPQSPAAHLPRQDAPCLPALAQALPSPQNCHSHPFTQLIPMAVPR